MIKIFEKHIKEACEDVNSSLDFNIDEKEMWSWLETTVD